MNIVWDCGNDYVFTRPECRIEVEKKRCRNESVCVAGGVEGWR